MTTEWPQVRKPVKGLDGVPLYDGGSSSEGSYIDDEIYIDEGSMDPQKPSSPLAMGPNQLLDGLQPSRTPSFTALAVPDLGYHTPTPPSSAIDPVLDSYLTAYSLNSTERKKKVESLLHQLSLHDANMDVDDVNRSSARSRSFRVHEPRTATRSPLKKAAPPRKINRAAVGRLFDVERIPSDADDALDLSLDAYFGGAPAAPPLEGPLRELPLSGSNAPSTAPKGSVMLPNLQAPPGLRGSLIPLSRAHARTAVVRSPKRVFAPVGTRPARSILKAPTFNHYNLLVCASNNSLDDATKYATEINALNAKDIPLPENASQVVTIPVTSGTESNKAAILRAASITFPLRSMVGDRGVYSERDWERFMVEGKTVSPVEAESKLLDPEGKRVRKKAKFPQYQRRVNWAEAIEW